MHVRLIIVLFRCYAHGSSGCDLARASTAAAGVVPSTDAPSRSVVSCGSALAGHPLRFSPAIAVAACRAEPMSQPHRSHYRRALLFTGHMVDLPSRPRPRFPPRMEAAAAHEIAAAMDKKLAHVEAR